MLDLPIQLDDFAVKVAFGHTVLHPIDGRPFPLLPQVVAACGARCVWDAVWPVPLTRTAVWSTTSLAACGQPGPRSALCTESR